ncbi:MAG: hypothetical protein IKA30_03840 [Alphaproteobacteria bacterium]|nr:hypothetical protein [Alphaproteobacteria bacterium]
MEQNRTKEISLIKQTIAKSQKTLLSVANEFLSTNEIIYHDEDFATKKPSVVVIFGSCLTAAKDAGDYLQNYYEKFGSYPRVICMHGLSCSRHIKLGESVDYWLKYILCEMGIPKNVVHRDSFDFSSGEAPIEVLRRVIQKRRYKNVAVFSSRGYSVTTAITLKEEMPDVMFKFYSNPYIPQELLCMDSENMNGYGLDLILGEIIRLNMRRESLPEYIQEHLITMDVVLKFVEKGYVLGIQSCREREAVGLGEEQYKSLLARRKAEFPWFSNKEDAYRRTKAQISELLQR